MVLIWLLPATICVYTFFKQRFLLSPTALFVMYFAVIFPLAYLVSYALDIPSFYVVSPRTIRPDKVFYAFCQAMLSLFAFLAGRYLIPAIRVDWPSVSFVRGRFTLLILSSSALATLGGVIVVHQIGGLSALIENTGEIRSGGLRGLGAATYAVTNLLPTVAQFWLMYAFRHQSKYLKWILTLCVASCLLAGVFGFRGGVFFLVLQVACICYLMTGKSYRRSAFIAVPILGLLVSALGYLRLLATPDPIVQAVLASPDRSELLGLMADTALTRTRGVETVVLMNDYMNHSNYHYFTENIEETMHAVIPSFLFPKDISLSEKIGTEVYSGYLVSSGIDHDIYGGVSYSLVAESAWNLGLAGIALTGLAVGYLFRTVEDRDEINRTSYLYVIVYKSLAAVVIAILESPQLAVNSFLLNLVLNGGILIFLSVRAEVRAPVQATPSLR